MRMKIHSVVRNLGDVAISVPQQLKLLSKYVPTAEVDLFGDISMIYGMQCTWAP